MMDVTNQARIIGVDPGLDGALCLLGGDAPEIWDVPTLELNGRRRIDEVALAHLFDRWSGFAPTMWIEDVGPMPKDGAIQAFGFGRTLGALRMAAAAQFIPIQSVRPAKWKKAMGLPTGSDKDASRHRANELCPQYARHWTLKKHHNRAEALLIALYGAKQ